MAQIRFTSALKRFYPDLKPLELEVSSISEVIASIEEMYPGLTDYLVDEQGALRKHVNIYIGENLIEDRTNLKDIVNPSDEVLIFQALSGG
ncbi:MAG: MoaD/ThiS family protein [Saprospiraceae bacterium]|nr:MoaD/ThiS family protein [Saprospiraceae bacterium]